LKVKPNLKQKQRTAATGKAAKVKKKERK